MSAAALPDARQWAAVIQRGSTTANVQAVIRAINAQSALGHVKKADAIVACIQILAQVIAAAGPEITADVRTGIIALIDGYATQAATEQ